jgi:hypothetical protein
VSVPAWLRKISDPAAGSRGDHRVYRQSVMGDFVIATKPSALQHVYRHVRRARVHAAQEIIIWKRDADAVVSSTSRGSDRRRLEASAAGCNRQANGERCTMFDAGTDVLPDAEEYLAHLREQHTRLQSPDRHDYNRDPFFYTPSQYRYHRGGRYHETNQYGLDLLRQAVNDGYEQGYRAGRADRDDRWPSNYRDCYAYQDANYGYSGFYVDATITTTTFVRASVAATKMATAVTTSTAASLTEGSPFWPPW